MKTGRKRWIVRVKYSRDAAGWNAFSPDYGEMFDWLGTRREAVKLAAEACRDHAEGFGPAELVIYNRTNGRVSKDKRSYGRDPRKYRG